VLLSVRCTGGGAMSLSRSIGLLLEALIAGAVACGAMWLTEAVLRPAHPAAAVGFLAGGLAGVAAFTGVMALARGRDLWGWLRRAR
jgi:hypothetical protein